MHGRKVAGGRGGAEHSFCPASCPFKLCVHPVRICVGRELAHMYRPASAGQNCLAPYTWKGLEFVFHCM